MTRIFAHRGFSGRYPEHTVGAFTAAIELAETRALSLGIECDVHFTADGRLGCLHDLDVSRTGRVRNAHGKWVPAKGKLAELSADDLASIDFGAWRAELGPSDADRRFTHLDELFDLVADARTRGVKVHLAVETKHPVPNDHLVEAELARMLRGRGWDGPDSPVRMITFDLAAIERMHRELPDLPTTILIVNRKAWRSARNLPPRVAVGAMAALLLVDFDLLAEIRQAGREFHVWTVNEALHLAACVALGVDAITTDFPDRALDAIRNPATTASLSAAARELDPAQAALIAELIS